MSCENAANGCGVYVPCIAAPGICATGKAANSGFSYICPLDVPAGSLPNGAGGLCYDSQADCSVGPNACNSTVNPSAQCSLQPNRCATGLAGGNGMTTTTLHDSGNASVALGYNWLCVAGVPPGSVQSGAGARCYTTAELCESGPNGCSAQTPCELDTTLCATGSSAGSSPPHQYSCPLDYPVGAKPNGFGAWCYNDTTACANGPNPCGTAFPCENNPSMCATGAAGNANNLDHGNAFAFYCALSTPHNALPNGGGQLCFSTQDACDSGPNACSGSVPCTAEPSLCATGIAAGSGNVFVCALSLPNGSMPNGGGRLCYDSQQNCLLGPNTCDNTTCSLQVSRCATGMAVGALQPYQWLCSNDINPTSKATGSGTYCYSTPVSCETAANGCGIDVPCVQEPSYCATGKAAQSGFTYICPLDLVFEALPTGAGELCYRSQAACNVGPNACSVALPCGQDPKLCSTGIAAADSSSVWACSLSYSNGGAFATPNGGGQHCYSTRESCSEGPNACSVDNCTLQYDVCSTGRSAGSAPPNNNWFCTLDMPSGSAPTASGRLCYKDMQSCFDGPNACDLDNVCVSQLASCQSGLAVALGYTIVCRSDIPAESTENGAGENCYTSQQACEEGPTACSLALGLRCVQDFQECSTGGASGSLTWTWFCPADAPTGGLPNAAGVFCYDVPENCEAAANSCSVRGPTQLRCDFDAYLCSSGSAAAAVNSFICRSDLPMGSASSLTTGLRCYGDTTARTHSPHILLFHPF